jgi:predicted nucleic acid-binding protein
VLAGGVIAAALAAMLNILGAAIGATTVDAVGRATPDAASFGIGAVVWLVVANTIALAVGGYTAARLSGSADGTDGVLHGLAVWAIAFLASATLLGNLAAGAVATAASAASTVAGTAATSVGSAVSAVAGQASPEAVLQRAQDTLRGTGNAPATMTTEQRSAEISSLLARRVGNGAFTAEERARLNALVAAESNIPAEEATRRVQSVEDQAQRTAAAAAQRARTAAGATARAASIGAFGAFAALLLGAIAAVLGARRGTRDWVALRAAAPRIAPRTA